MQLLLLDIDTKGSLVGISLISSKLSIDSVQRYFSLAHWLLDAVLVRLLILIVIGVILTLRHLMERKENTPTLEHIQLPLFYYCKRVVVYDMKAFLVSEIE